MSNETVTWHRVAKRDEVGDGDPLGVQVGDTLIGLYLLDGEIHALSNVCSHEFAVLTDGFVNGDCIECPLHAAEFDIRTGKALSPPADEDIATYPVKIEGDEIFVGLSDA